ncbi:cell division protein SepF [cyanobacterium endosymbiont of Epithemia turgida]|uniref:cell division protein SepF n=1 Tax=cyanobacterium endosymbiont of Epithemia turgida TaxID=718217 RepID=UPI0005C49F8A|nr:cell division protein SepF [cyanobacterium endosymbiont of Epithemia turgida]
MSLTEKLKRIVGIDEPVYDEYDSYDSEDYKEMDEEQQLPSIGKDYAQPSSRNRDLNLASDPQMGTNRNNVIGMPGIPSSIAEVVVVEPHSFDEMPQVIQILRERKSVVLNLNVMDPEEAQRAVDFVAGGTYAIDGHQERIGESIFLFTPSCIKVSTLSGMVHDVPEVHPSSARTSAPTPSWGTDSSRMVQ